MQKFSANIVNIFDNTIYFGELTINEGRIFNIKRISASKNDVAYIIPGFVDSHIHIESSMLTPSQFGKMAVVHGTISTVSDPHEVANVLGLEGVEYMINDGNQIPFIFNFGAPSCVPATSFETAGDEISVEQIERLLAKKEIKYLAEMMNFPGVINDDSDIIKKIDAAKFNNKPVDGHAPGLQGEDCIKYFSAGISTDHECFTFEEAEEKLKLGVKILIREGSAAKNFDALIPLAKEHAASMMFCSDDKHPDELAIGHINLLVKKAVASGVDVFDVLRMASLNPVRHYNIDMGLLREGERADFIMVDNLSNFEVLSTYIKGKLVAQKGTSFINAPKSTIINKFNAKKISPEALNISLSENTKSINVIKVNDGQLITDKIELELDKGINIGDYEDILKIVVYNRYTDESPQIGFITGFGIKNGAIASSVAHDSHNIIAVGSNDAAISDAVNLIVREKGGISAVSENKMGVLPLPIAGLMSNRDGHEVANDYTQIDAFAKNILKSTLKSPFMSLSFMALLVIPSLKLSDKGLFDGNTFSFIPVSN